MNRKFNIGDMVICKSSGVVGKTIKFYFPTASAEQTMVITNDGRNYHAPTSEWVRISERKVHDSEFTRQEIEIIMIVPTSRAALAASKKQSTARAAAHFSLFVNPFLKFIHKNIG